MNKHMILFVLGKDRPGIVDEVTTVLFNKQANILDSRMATLGGSFSIMILLSCPAEAVPGLKTGLEQLQRQGFQTSLHEAHDPDAEARQPELPLKLEVRAMDHPGIVNKVVRIFRQHNANITQLNTLVTKAPLSGAPLFDLELEAGVPADRSITKIKTELSALADELNLDLAFKR